MSRGAAHLDLRLEKQSRAIRRTCRAAVRPGLTSRLDLSNGGATKYGRAPRAAVFHLLIPGRIPNPCRDIRAVSRQSGGSLRHGRWDGLFGELLDFAIYLYPFQVTLNETIGGLQLNAGVGLMRPRSVQNAFDAANAAFYRDVDWALDIRNAEFYECDLNSVPYRLVRRDPATQFVVTRERALRTPWKELDLAGAFWGHHIEKMLEGNLEGVVLVAPKGHPRHFASFLRGLKVLREVGVAEPD